MNSKISWSFWTFFYLLTLLSLEARGQSATARVRTAQDAVTAAQTKLTLAQQSWGKAQQDFNAALAAHRTASNKVMQARQAAVQRHAPGIGMTAAAAERDTATRQLSARRKAIETELKGRDDFKLAMAEAEAARNRLSDLPDDRSLTEEQQQKLSSELAAKVRRPTELRKETEANDPEMKQITERLQTAGKKILELQPLLRQAIDTDPEVTRALEQEKKEAAAVEKERTTTTRLQQDVVSAELNLERQQQQLQATLAQTRRRR